MSGGKAIPLTFAQAHPSVAGCRAAVQPRSEQIGVPLCIALFRFQELSHAHRRELAHRLDRLTSRFAYAVIAATGLLFAFHGIRFAARIWGL